MPTNRNRGQNEEDRRRREANRDEKGQGTMTVAEAGHKGGQRVRELIQEGEKVEEGKSNR